MTEKDSVKARQTHRIVGVITSRAGLELAARLTKPPDLLELRLDHLVSFSNQVEQFIPRLPSPLIITARDFREGGAGRLSVRERRDLLMRFLPCATFVDIEMRSMPALASIFERAHARNVRCILSLHNFRSTPSPRLMVAKARAAQGNGAEFFKIVTRVDTARQLARLLEFMNQRPSGISVSAMGIGKLGASSRIALAKCGSVMTYAYLGKASVEGQPSLAQVRRAFAALKL